MILEQFQIYLLFFRWILCLAVVEIRELWVRVLECPLEEVICQIEATIVVGTILKIDDHQFGFSNIAHHLR